MPIADPIAATSNASATTQTCGFVGLGQLLREPALQAQRRELRGELDDQDGISEAAERPAP